jgi:hypothetical protein
LQKKRIIGLFLIILTGCSVTKIRSDKVSFLSSDATEEKVIENLKKQNISSGGFYLSKVELKLFNQEGTEKFIGSVKYDSSGKFLISLKSLAGIEIARIMLTNDSVLMNDRINKKLYQGSSKYLMKKYGVYAAVIPLIFGDYIDEEHEDKVLGSCSEGKLELDGSVNGIKVKYVIDCKRAKIQKTYFGSSINKESIEITFSDFIGFEKGLVPGRISINDKGRNMKMEIGIKKIVSSWKGNSEFIPGKQYEIIQLQ